MSPERWARVKELFDQALERDPKERAAFLEQACGDDAEIRREVESLLASDAEGATLLDRPVAEVLGELIPRPATGRLFGAYRTVREIGRGGMAVVYAGVRDDDQYSKQVAIKLIKRGMDTDAIVARFLKERQILANLEHPNIARLLDGGMSDDGLPYLVMEFVDGVRIDDFCTQRGLPLEARLDLFRTVCSAVLYAHQNLVVHRDLKPSNILVTGDGVPKLLDFGIAKLLDHERQQQAAGTVDELRPMTPEYASPEQLRGQPITTASDIYALGVLLYRLLTGHHPYRLESRSPREIEQAICERDPERPSTVIDRGPAVEEPSTDTATTAPATTGRDRATRKLRRRLAGDLDNIVLMALHKVPEKRYGSVEQLSEDIRRHLEGLPVMARPDTLAYRSAKFVRRHRWGVTAALLLFTSLVAGIVATAWQANLARSERAAAEDVTDFLVDLFEYSRPDKTLGETITVQKLLDLGADRIERELGDQPDRRARLMDSIGFAYFKLGSYDDAEPQLEEALDLRRQIFGERHPSVAVSLNRLGELRREQGHYREAEALHRRALQMARRLRSSDRDEILADILNGLAVVLYKQERHDEAEPLLRQALDLRRSLHDEDHQETAYVLNNLALVALAREQYEEAESLSKKALEINRRLLGEDHPEVAVNLSNLAEALRAQKRCDEAIELYEETLARRIKVLGEKHPSLATTQSNLAGCLQDLDRYEEAETTYRESLNLRLETLGPEHPAVAESWNNLGRVFYDQRNFAQAEECYREALAIYRGLGQEDLQVAKNLQNLAVTLEALRELDAAEIYHRESLELNRRLLGERDPNLAVSRYRLARVLVRQGEHEEATGEFQAALDIQRESLKPQDPALAQTLTGLSFTLLETGQPERAEGLARESLSLWQQWPVEQWSKIVQSQSLLGRSLAAQGRFADAEPLLLDSYSALRQQRGEADRSTQRELARVIDLYEAWDRPDEAARYRGLLTE